MNKIRVLHILSDTNIGGAGRLLFNLSQSIDKSKFEFIFVFPKGSKLIKMFKNQGRIYTYQGIGDKSCDLKAITEIQNIIKREEPSIVHTHSSLSGRIAAITSGIKKYRIVYTKHCVFNTASSKKRILRRKIYRFIDNLLAGHIIAVAESAKDELVYKGVDPQKIKVIINGSIPQIQLSEQEKIKLKAVLGISDNNFVVGICARLEKYKGHKTFINAALLAKQDGENIKFIIMGDGSQKEALMAYSKDLNLDNSIIFTGFVDNVSDYLNILDLNINCSTGTETSCLAISEGLSLGIPAIVSDFGGNPHMVINGITGFIFEQNNHAQLYKIIKNLKNSPHIIEKMKKNAINDFNNRFSAIQMAKSYEDFYVNIVSNS